MSDEELPPEGPLQTRRRTNFVARYWRGEVALGPSYWLVYLLLSLAIGRAIAYLQQRVLVGASYEPKLLFAVLGGGFAATLPITIWQLVGLWRAARMRRAARRAIGRRAMLTWLVQANVIVGTLALVAVLAMTTGPSLVEVAGMAFLGDPGIPDYGFRTMRGGREAEIVGGFKFGLTRDFTALMAANPQLEVVHLDSLGGRIGEARHLYRAIRMHGLDTYVASACFSACTMAFAAGKRRFLGPHATLGFHAPAFPGLRSRGSAMVNFEAQTFATAGFSPAFTAKAVAVIPPALWKPSRQELVDAHVVTGMVGPGVFADSGAGLDLRPARWKAEIEKALPALEALARNRPELFKPIAEASLRAYRNGESAEAVGHILGLGYQSAFRAMLPTANDATLVAYAQLVVDEYTALQRRSPIDCYLYGSGRAGSRNFLSELGPALASRDAALKTRVLATVAPRDTLSAPEAQAVRLRFIRQLAVAATPSELKALSKPQDQPAGQAAYCRGLIATFATAAAMDPISAGAVLAHLLGDTEGAGNPSVARGAGDPGESDRGNSPSRP